MAQDVESKEQNPVLSNSEVCSDSPTTLQHLKDIAELIKTGAHTEEVSMINKRAIWWTAHMRNKLKTPVISAIIDFALVPGSKVYSQLSSYIPNDNEQDMEIDTTASASQASVRDSPIELEIYCSLIVLIYLIDQKRLNEAKACSSASIEHLKMKNLRTRPQIVDVLASRLYFYYSLSYELTGDLAEIRDNLIVLHNSAISRHDELGQEILLNLLLRNYLAYNLYDRAAKLRLKTPCSEPRSNEQLCRYLFYSGKIQTIQLDYTEAKNSLLYAAHRAPTSALGFRIQCNKWAVIVRLLLGEIPQRTLFMQKGMEKALRPYFELTRAVRIGDLEMFKTVADEFSSIFISDRTSNLIVRLRHNVIRTRLERISITYSRISLADVAEKLRLNVEEDAKRIASKAIRDGVIDSKLDHDRGWMLSKEGGDICSRYEPQRMLSLRIDFCLDLYNEATCALRFPPHSFEDRESAEKRRERLKQAERAFIEYYRDMYF